MLLKFYCPLVRFRWPWQHFCQFEGTISKMIIRRNTLKYLGHINKESKVKYIHLVFVLTLYGTLDDRHLYKQVMKYHYAMIQNHKHNTFAKLPLRIYLARELIDKWDVLQNGNRHGVIVGHV